jgi:tetratricopeptide (TPR) repeat protein
VKRAHETDPSAEGPALLALEMLPKTPAVENVVAGYLAAPQARAPIRLVYARALTEMQRYADAVVQLEAATRTDPKMAPAWLSLGALHVELRHPAEAEAALTRYLELAKDSATGEADESAELGTTQARLLLAQLAEQRQDFRAAENWLAQIDSPQRALDVQVRRASLLAKQGRLDQARELVRSTPERTGDDARAKLLAEAQLLRDQKLWAQAHDVLAQANLRFPDDVDLLYEQAMVAEKLDRLDQMETLLRRVMTIKPTHQHAYNALGYSLADRNLRLPEARELIKKALELAPGDPFITDSLGWVEFRMGNRDEALRLLREAYRARPDAEIGAHLGEVLWVSGQRNEALRIWREARTRDATNEVLRETLQRLRVEL